MPRIRSLAHSEAYSHRHARAGQNGDNVRVCGISDLTRYFLFFRIS
jgi:hypothetical protein